MDLIVQSLLREYATSPSDELAHRIVALLRRQTTPLDLVNISPLNNLFMDLLEYLNGSIDNLEIGYDNDYNQISFKTDIRHREVLGTIDLRTDPPLANTEYVNAVQIDFMPRGRDDFLSIHFQDDGAAIWFAWEGENMLEDGTRHNYLYPPDNDPIEGAIKHFNVFWKDYSWVLNR